MSTYGWALTVAGVNIGLWSLLNFWVYYNLFLIWLAWRARKKSGPVRCPDPKEWPGVTVQLPL